MEPLLAATAATMAEEAAQEQRAADAAKATAAELEMTVREAARIADAAGARAAAAVEEAGDSAEEWHVEDTRRTQSAPGDLEASQWRTEAEPECEECCAEGTTESQNVRSASARAQSSRCCRLYLLTYFRIVSGYFVSSGDFLPDSFWTVRIALSCFPRHDFTLSFFGLDCLTEPKLYLHVGGPGKLSPASEVVRINFQ